ncbi:hypothetical protein MCOR25_007656 [Pyricularia grisea]|nr:hypothetical protein MCOR25_007656 [Pyricularia grisea]
MNAYDMVLRNGPSGAETHVPEGHSSVHSRHCFDYLKQVILCNLDMTLEGSKAHHEAGTDGYGQQHVCRSYPEALDWIDARRPWDTRDFIDLHEGGEV